MLDLLNSLDILHQSFWYLALGSSFIFLIQTVFTFLGGDGEDGLNADFDGDLEGESTPFQLFSFRNLVHFLLGFGWAGVAFYDSIESKALLLILAFGVGVIFVLIFLLLIKQILKLSEDNTFDIQKLIGRTGEVYLKIPAKRQGKGKILVSLNGSNHELNALTDSEIEISTGSFIKIVAIEKDILIVEKI